MFARKKTRKKIDKNRVLERKIGFFYVVLILTIFLLFLFFGYNYNKDSNYKKLVKAQLGDLTRMENSLQNDMEIDSQRLLIFSMSNYIKNLLSENDPDSKAILDDMFLAYVKELDSFDQIRVIGADGMEIVRVDKDANGNARILPEEQLQNKSDRYYYKAIMGLNSNDIYISLFDLNVEHEEVEVPEKPVIRIGKGIMDDKGEMLGMIIINIMGQDLLDNLKEINEEEYREVYMLDENGYYLYSKEPDKAYRFMFPTEEQVGFFSDYNEVWKRIENGETEIATESDSYFVKKMSYLDNLKYTSTNRHAYLVISLSKVAIDNNNKQLMDTIIYAVFIFVPIIAIFEWSFGVNRVREKVYQEKLEENSNIDSLTKLYNRRMIISYLNESINTQRRKNDNLSVLFIDINNLKYVNDHLGHKMGDTMIIGAANSLTSSVRKSDFVARLGGDEFLIILPKCTQEDADSIMKRALEKFSDIGMEEANSRWVMSYGYAQLEQGESCNELLQRADKLMYENKKETKAKEKNNGEQKNTLI